jgi:type I restriction enzyme S subunit
MSFPRYPEYKDSGVEWVGHVPVQWDTGTLRWLTCRYSGGTPDKTKLEYWEDGTIPWLNSGAVNDRLIAEPSTYITDEAFANSSAKWIPKGALVMALAGQGKTKGMVAQLGIPSTCNQSMAAIIPGGAIEARFLFWWLDANYQNIRNMAGGDLRDGLNLELLGNIQCPLPSHDEQTQIAAFLDRETARIDELVAEQRRLMDLLKEKRQAVISHAVTKGLNPNAPMNPSGIEWLGNVPEHWDVKPLRMVANVVRGASPRPAGDPRYFGGDAVPWVTVGEITKDDSVYLTETESLLTDEGAKHSNLFKAGTLIYSNSGATLGVPKVLSIDACANDGVVSFMNLDKRVQSEFLFHCLASITDSIREKVKQGSGQPNLNTDIVKDLRFGFPPLPEQELIVSRITELVNEFAALTTEAQRAIDLLQERRTALISAAVTGQIDVRHLSVREPA